MLWKLSHLFYRENQVHQENADLHTDGDQILSRNQVKERRYGLKQDPVQDQDWIMCQDWDKQPASWSEGEDKKKLVQAFFSCL